MPGSDSFSRRKFINITSASLIGMALQGTVTGFPKEPEKNAIQGFGLSGSDPGNTNLIGDFGTWAAEKLYSELPAFSFRRKEWSRIERWRKAAKERTVERLAMPDLGRMPEIKINKQYTWDGLHIEEMTWQLPYGRPTEAILLKPAGAVEPLPGILAFHEHGANKYFGTRKITRTSDSIHPLCEESQQHYYDGFAWANEIAKRGYVVLVQDAFPFASRRVFLQDVTEFLRNGLNDSNPENPSNIENYNTWSAQHEHVMAKSLFCAGTTWPGVWLGEDVKALDILCARKDVDSSRIGCGGLSGGGMRTVFTGGLDSRIKCSVCVGLMSTWKDFLLYKSQTHTWMTFVPLLPNELDFPEILGLSVPNPALVLNAEQDALFTLEEMKKADDILKAVYDKAGASERYRCSFHPGPHKFTAGMQMEAFDWFDKWLK